MHSLRDIEAHWKRAFGPVRKRIAASGPSAGDLPEGFHVLVFPQSGPGEPYRYATMGMSMAGEPRLEIYLCAPFADDDLADILFAIAHYHLTGAPLGWGHTVNLGVPWLQESECDHALLTLPHLDGAQVEIVEGTDVRCLWVVPITDAEREFKKLQGVDALEDLFREQGTDVIHPLRASVV